MIESRTDLLRTTADSLLGLPYETWSFGDSVAFDAMIAASDTLDDDRWTTFARGYFRSWATRAEPFVWNDCTAPGLAMVKVYERTNDSMVLEAALHLADYLITRPRLGEAFLTWVSSPLQHPYGPGQLSADETALLVDPPPGVFVDCLHFDPPFFVAAGIVSGRDDLVEEGVLQAAEYVRLLQTDSGLFDHFVLEGRPGTFGPGWGRGQGWALLGLLDVLEYLPSEHAARPSLGEATAKLVAVMIDLQRTDGHWHTVVNVESSGVETSTAAFMAAGFRKASEMGVVDRRDVNSAAERALGASLASLDALGNLTGVSAAVNACTEPTHYEHVPSGFVVPWGQGPLVLALTTAEGT